MNEYMVTGAMSVFLGIVVGVVIGNLLWKYIIEPFLDERGW